MKISCPHCNTELECDGSSAGQMVACPQCNGKFTVPAPTATVVSRAAGGSAQPESVVMSGYPSWLPFIPGLVIGVPLILAFGIGLLIILIVVWRRYSMKYILTTKNLRVIHGVVVKNETSVRLNDIRGIAVKRGLLDALTGCGTVIVGTAATADAEITIPHIKNPKLLQNRLNELRDQAG